MSERGSTATGGGLSIGAVIAIVMSWTINKSVIWAFLHALCGWLYVIYWLLTYSGQLP